MLVVRSWGIRESTLSTRILAVSGWWDGTPKGSFNAFKNELHHAIS